METFIAFALVAAFVAAAVFAVRKARGKKANPGPFPSPRDPSDPPVDLR